MKLTPAQARTIVPWFRMSFVPLAWARPRWLYSVMLMDADANADSAYLIRLVESRGLVVGALATGIGGERATRIALRAGAVVDTLDLVSSFAAYRSGQMSRGRFAWVAAIGGGFAVLGIYASEKGAPMTDPQL